MVKGVIPALKPITLLESKQDKLFFKAIVLKWDKNNPEWSTKSSNGVRYNRQSILEAFQKAIEENSGLPVLYNHIIEGDSAKVLGRITKVVDTSEGLIVEGYLDSNDPIVNEKIKPGYLTNVSLQVIAEDYWRESNEEDGETIYAKPSRALEVSFVPVNGVEGAKLLDLAIAESLKIKEDITPSPGKSIIRLQSDKQQKQAFTIISVELGIKDINGGYINGYYIEIPKDKVEEIVNKLKERGIKVLKVIKEDITTTNSSAVMTTKMAEPSKDKDYKPKVKEQEQHVRDLGNVIGIFEDKDLAEEYIQLKSKQGQWEVQPTQSGKFAVIDVYGQLAENLVKDNEVKKILLEYYKAIVFDNRNDLEKAKSILDENGIDYYSDEDSIEVLNAKDYQNVLKLLNENNLMYYE